MTQQDDSREAPSSILGSLMRRLTRADGDLIEAEAYRPAVLSAIHHLGLTDDTLSKKLKACGVAPEEVRAYRTSATRHVQGLRFHTINSLANLPPLTYLAEDMIENNGLTVLYGPSGSGKTFLALDLAMSVATGTSWLDEVSTASGPAFYVAAEGAYGIRSRASAWQQARKTDAAASPFRLIPSAVNLFDDREVTAFAEEASNYLPEGGTAKLVVFDTLARCSVGAEENSAKDMGVVIEHASRVKRALNTTVLLVHHTGKDPSKGARGSSAIKAATDTEMMLEPGGVLTLTCGKQKNGPEFDDVPVRLEPVGDSLVPFVVSASDALDRDKVDAIEAVLTAADEPLSTNEVVQRVTGKATTIRDHVNNLASDPGSPVVMEPDGQAKRFDIDYRESAWSTAKDDDGMTAAA